MFKFNLGDEVKHNLTPFKGTIVARTEWLNGCKRYNIQGKELKDNMVGDLAVIDEQELTLVKAVKPVTQPARGGPQRDSKSPVARIAR